jgi:pimeloyl-ACP methyl ester carboxylesterase
MPLVPLTVVVSALLGWSDIEIQPSRGDRAAAAYRSVATLDRPTERTVETLRRYNLEGDYRRDVNYVLLRIEKFARHRAEPELVYALAELSWIEGKRLERRRKAQALDRYLDAAVYAWDFLFDDDPVLAEGRKPADPRYRQAMELYNAGLDHLIRAAMSRGEIRPENGKVITFKFHGGERKIRFVFPDSPWQPGDVQKLLLATDFEVSGLNHEDHQYGLGVPLIAIREARTDKKGGREPGERFYPAEMAFPMTATLFPDSRLHDARADQGDARVCTLMLNDPIKGQTVGTPRNKLAMEIDLTTPLAYMWSHTDLERYRWSGLMRPEKNLERANLLLIRPYEPDKIPVVMVHGLISSPLAWIPMLNELLRDPEIQKRYQFILYMYPTGVPIPIAAASLRNSLQEAGRMYNPDGRDPAFNRMVLLGHSMGGLLSHMMSVSSGDELWRLYTDRSFKDEIIGSRQVLEELQRYLFFEPLPFVTRVVFLATPHRGSDLSRGMVGRVGKNLIADPDHIQDLLHQLIKDNPHAFDSRRFRRFPSSIETLDPASPILAALLKMKPGPGVTFHSVIGAIRPSGIDQSTDGVVAYPSAHIDLAPPPRYEKVVRSDHGVQKADEAIREVLRILHEHLGETQGAPAIQEARGPGDASPVRLEPPATVR